MSGTFGEVRWDSGLRTWQWPSSQAPKSFVHLLRPSVCETQAFQNRRRPSRVWADDLRRQKARKGGAFRRRNLRWMGAIPRALRYKAGTPASFEDAGRSFPKKGSHSGRREQRHTEKIQWHIDDRRWIVQNAIRRFEPAFPFLLQGRVVPACANPQRRAARETAGQSRTERKLRPI